MEENARKQTVNGKTSRSLNAPCLERKRNCLFVHRKPQFWYPLKAQARGVENQFEKIMFTALPKVMSSPQPGLNRQVLVFEIMGLLRVLNPYPKLLKILSCAHVPQKDPHRAGVKTGVTHALQIQTLGGATWK